MAFLTCRLISHNAPFEDNTNSITTVHSKIQMNFGTHISFNFKLKKNVITRSCTCSEVGTCSRWGNGNWKKFWKSSWEKVILFFFFSIFYLDCSWTIQSMYIFTIFLNIWKIIFFFLSYFLMHFCSRFNNGLKTIYFLSKCIWYLLFKFSINLIQFCFDFIFIFIFSCSIDYYYFWSLNKKIPSSINSI